MSDTPTPRTNKHLEGLRQNPELSGCNRTLDFARELERELATENAINQRNCEDWAHDHTHLQNLCREVGFSEHDVEGDSYGIRAITQLGDMLRSKVAELERELDEQVLCNGKGAEREADLLGKVERLQRELAEEKYQHHLANGVADLAMKHRDEAERENALLREVGKALRDALAFECHKIGDCPREIAMWDALCSSQTPPNDRQGA